MTKKAVTTREAPQAIGPYSQAVRCGQMVFVSGQIPLSAQGELAASSVPEQTERCLLNLKAILAEAGLDLNHVVKTTVYMTDLSQFSAMNEIYGRFFQAPYPARATVEVSALPKGVGVEIEAVAVAG